MAAVSLLIGDGFIGPANTLILTQIRLPRTALAILVGAALGLSGAVLQGALRNPLADPGLLGITPAASLGAMIAFYWGFASRFARHCRWGASWRRGQASRYLLGIGGRQLAGPTLILAGVAVSALSGALMSLALTLAPNPFALAEITFWLLGGLEDRALIHVALAGPPISLGAAA